VTIHSSNLSGESGLLKKTTSYKIPGLHGSLVPREQLANLGWYQNYNEDELKKILTDSDGISHKFSLGVGKINPTIKEEQRNKVAAILPPQFSEVFQKIQSPFIQAVTDNLTTKSVFMNGKVLLIGDAVAGVRPHTGAGTAQAAMHAFLLKKVFEEEGSMSVEEWEKAILGWATMAHDIGVQAGNLGQFGDHPMADNGESPN
jgi:2-polyprenyl-6-methoxyphenol hydroxylase-like FAD-dependent oxidoreductase